MIENHITVIESENQIEINLKMNGRLLQINLYISLLSTLFLSFFLYILFFL
jgi:hypothetical protein